jgi:hypothetical protein
MDTWMRGCLGVDRLSIHHLVNPGGVAWGYCGVTITTTYRRSCPKTVVVI